MALATPTTRPPCGLRGPALRDALRQLGREDVVLPSPLPESPRRPPTPPSDEVQEMWDHGPEAMAPRDLAVWLARRSPEPESGVRRREPEP
jgi:hypothetical protein